MVLVFFCFFFFWCGGVCFSSSVAAITLSSIDVVSSVTFSFVLVECQHLDSLIDFFSSDMKLEEKCDKFKILRILDFVVIKKKNYVVCLMYWRFCSASPQYTKKGDLRKYLQDSLAHKHFNK